MAEQISATRINHTNIVVEDFDASVQRFKDLYDAEFVLDLPSPAFHACLMSFGDVLFEIFVPEAYLLNARYGPFHLGIEYQADIEQVRRVIADQGIRVIRDIGHALHTHPDDTLGVSFEFYDQAFAGREWPLLGRPTLPLDYWTNEHPLGMSGQVGYSIAVDDLDAGVAFLRRFFATETVYEEPRPVLAGTAVGLRVGGGVIEVLAPTGEGALRDYVRRSGQGIRSTLIGVGDLDAARAYFRERGVDAVPGSTDKRIMVPADANRGLLFEFGT